MKTLKIILCVFLALFGALTVFMGSSVIFDLFGIREIEGNYVDFVVKANLFCGLIYLFASYDIWHNRKAGAYVLLAAFIILVITFVFFFNHINQGGLYEQKTVKAMSFRTIITLIAAGLSFYLLKKQKAEIVNK
jgi:hypothetical protein